MAVLGITQHLSIKSILSGLGISLCVFGALFIYASIAGPDKIKRLEETLASKTIIINKMAFIEETKTDGHVPQKTSHQNTMQETAHDAPDKDEHGDKHVTHMEKPHMAQKQPKGDVQNHAAVELDHGDAGPDVLEPAPVEGLIENSEFGPLPRIHPETGITPFEAYRRPFTLNRQDKKLLSFVVTDYGLSKSNSERVLKALPKEVTFVLSPYAQDPQEWIDKARAKGHEVWLNIPIQNQNFGLRDPGPAALLLRSSLKHNTELMRQLMGSVQGYAGIASYTDEIFVNSPTLMKTTMGEIYKRGLAFMELNARPEDTIKDAALSGGAPYTEIDMVMEQLENKEFKISNLSILAGLAGDQGYAIAQLRPSPNIIKQFENWHKLALDQGLTLAPASATIGLTYTGISNPVPSPESVEDILYDN